MARDATFAEKVNNLIADLRDQLAAMTAERDALRRAYALIPESLRVAFVPADLDPRRQEGPK